MILQLAQQGKLSLDAPLSNYEPQIPNASRITIRELLDHTSGLGHGTSRLPNPRNPQRSLSPQQAIANTTKQRPLSTPGAAYHYSDTGYLILGEVAQKVTGTDIRTLIQRQVLALYHPRMRAARIAAGLVALVACAWFALGIRQAHDTAGARAVIASGAVSSTAGYHRALGSLHAASTLNPDREVDILRAEAKLDHGDADAAQRILLAVTRREPRNLEAWLWLAKSAGTDRQRLFHALTRVRALEPILPTS